MKRFSKGSTDLLSPNFRAKDFDCPCSACLGTTIQMPLVIRLQAMRNALGCPLIVTSGYRCGAHQKALEAQGYETAKNSQHLTGGAADVRTGKHSGKELEIVARGAAFRAVGVALTWVHVDLRGDKERFWNYTR